LEKNAKKQRFLAILAIFGQNAGKTRFLGLFSPKWAFSAILASRPRGFYINPSRRGPAVPAGGSPWGGGAPKLRGAEVPPLGAGALLAELVRGFRLTTTGKLTKNLSRV